MTKPKLNKRITFWILTPLFGSLLFLLLYLIATFYYPGGSQVNKATKGFSWAQNYWCTLLNETAINGQHNNAKPIAMFAMFVLAATLIIFWSIFPRQIGLTKKSSLIIQISGALSMLTGLLIFTILHDIVINVAGILGFIAMAGTFAGLYKAKWKALFWLGIFNLSLVVLNNILYYGNGLILYLPVVQKITFLSFLLWICLIDIQLFKRIKSQAEHPEIDEPIATV